MVKVKCDFSVFSEAYRCQLQSQIITQELIEFDGIHNDGKTNSDVDHLSIPNTALIKFPINIHKSFLHLTVFQMHKSKLPDNDLKREYFINLTGLVTFWITECGLTRLRRDLFKDLRKLEWVSFQNNKIDEVPRKTFNGLALKYLDFRGNKNIDMIFDSRTAAKITLDDVIGELREKCRPQPAPPQAIAQQPEVDEKDAEIQTLTHEVGELKMSLQKQEDLVKNLKDHIAVITQQKGMKNDLAITSLKKILADDDFKDFTINVGGASFKVHKLLFAARSQILREMFKNNPEAVELNLRDIPEATFKAVHDFIYNNQLPPDANLIEVFTAAYRLKMLDLKKEAAEQLMEKIDETNAFEVLVLSNKFTHVHLREKAFDVIKTKVFPDHQLSEKLAEQPEKLEKLIKTKRRLDQEFEEMLKDEDGGVC
jgi:hypothetical protein